MDELRLIAFGWLALTAFWAVRRIVRGRQSALNFVLLVHFAVTGVPLLLDVVVGAPRYRWPPMFNVVTNDETTTLVYCVFVSGVALFWSLAARRTVARSRVAAPQTQQLRPGIRMRFLWALLLPAPIFAALATSDPSFYSTFGAAARVPVEDRVAGHTIVEALAFISVLSAVLLVGAARRVRMTVLAVLPFVFAATWVQGRRFIILAAAGLLLYVLWRRGTLRGARLVFASATAAGLVGAFSLYYQATVRDISWSAPGSSDVYENVRLDYGRDHVIQQAIYAELRPEEVQILEHRGQSVLFSLLFWVPRSLWEDKPFPYAQYATSAAFNVRPQLWGWGITTSILDEALANFSWAGMILAPLFIVALARIGDRSASVEVGLMTAFVLCAFQVLQFSAFAPLFLAWVVLVFINRPKRRRRAPQRSQYSSDSMTAVLPDKREIRNAGA